MLPACSPRLGRAGTFDYVMIEASGVAEPLPIAETFTFDDEVSHRVYVDEFLRRSRRQRRMGCCVVPCAGCTWGT